MKTIQIATAVLLGLGLGASVSGSRHAAAQTATHQHTIEQRLQDQRAKLEAHRKKMEGIADPDQRSLEMRKHFQMTEEMLALMLEQRKVMAAKAPATAAAPSATPSAPASGSMSGQGMGGMMGQMGGMMGKEMGGMPGGPTPGGAMPGGAMEKEMGGMQGAAMPGAAMPGASAPSAPGMPMARKSSDMDQMMQRIAEHSKYMETIQDRSGLGQEMLRHQKMLDQMLEMML